MMGVVREPFHLETVFLLGWSLAMDNIPSLPYTWLLGVRSRYKWSLLGIWEPGAGA